MGPAGKIQPEQGKLKDGFLPAAGESWATPMMSTGKFGSGSPKRDSSQPDTTGLLGREQYDPGR